jgi:hypothetical protein
MAICRLVQSCGFMRYTHAPRQVVPAIILAIPAPEMNIRNAHMVESAGFACNLIRWNRRVRSVGCQRRKRRREQQTTNLGVGGSNPSGRARIVSIKAALVESP